MTGFGQVVKETQRLIVKAEVKSLNSKNLDVNARMTKPFFDREIEARNMVISILERGKININLEVQFKEISKPKAFNEPLISAYYKALKNIAVNLDDIDPAELFRLTMKMPEVMSNDIDIDAGTDDWSSVFEILKEAALACDNYRIEEGNVLESKLEEYVENIRSLSEKVMAQDGERIITIRTKLQEKLLEYAGDEQQVDNNRFEQELIYYLEKLDISEEKVRLDSHLNYFIETMQSEKSNGKKLGFISQEIGREINTIGSKVADAAIQRIVVEMKDELEKIKEQCLNIL